MSASPEAESTTGGHVLLVEPHPRPGIAMARYGDGLVALLESHFSTSRTTARHLEPRGLLRHAFRGRDQTGITSAATNYDVVHMTDIYMSPHCGRFAGARIVTVHDLMPREFRRWWPLRSLRFSAAFERSRRHLTLADLVITPSEYTRRQLLKSGPLPASRVLTVPPAFPEEMQPDPGLKREPKILSVGPSPYYKNFALMLHALARPELDGAHMVRVGQLNEVQRALAEELGVLHRIEETGHLSDAELIRQYQTCAVLAQPSYSEGFGLPVAEAMLCGLPVVASDGGALPEVVGAAGIVVPLRGRVPRRPPDLDDARDFAVALANVLADARLQRTMSEAGLREAERFQRPGVREQLLAAYATAMEFARARNGA